MQNVTPLYLTAAGFGMVIGLSAFFILIKLFLKDRKFAPQQSPTIGHPESDSPERKNILTGKSSIRSTNTLALLPTGIVRLRTGGYMLGFELRPAKTIWADSFEVDKVFDEFASMVTSNVPTGTLTQIRRTQHPEAADILLDERLKVAEAENVVEIARNIEDDQLDYLGWLSSQGNFNRNILSMWIYLPLKHKNEKSRNALSEFFSRIKTDGIGKSFSDIKNGNAVLRRTVDEERFLIKEAEDLFDTIERNAPKAIKLRRYEREEMWKSLYYSHNENAESAPPAPQNPLIDLRTVLCSGEPIRSSNNSYLLHGHTPVTILTLFLPPASDERKRGCYAGMARAVSINQWTNRTTFLTEFITLDKQKVESSLKWRRWQLEKTSLRPKGQVKMDKKKSKAYSEIDSVENDLLNPDNLIVQMRFRVVLYGNRSETAEELEINVKSLKDQAKNMIALIQREWKGADIALESPEALHATYEQTLIGNAELSGSTGREIEERADSLVSFTPLEDTWDGMVQPHSIKRTPAGKVFGVNFWQIPYTKSPLVIVLGAPGTGKSVEMGAYVLDVLARVPKARVKIVEFGETYAWLCKALGGKHFLYTPDNVRAINIWHYQGLERGESPEEPQINLVVEDAAILGGFDDYNELNKFRKSILFNAVIEVYKDVVPRNRIAGIEAQEPILSDLVEKLTNFPFKTEEEIREASHMASILSVYQNNKWLDAPTHPELKEDSPLEVFELDSLKFFPDTVQKALAFRTGSRVIRSIGEKINDEYTPALNVFDEMHEYKDNPNLEVIFRATEKGARKGRKTNVITMLGTHGYHDVESLHGLTDTAGCYIIGQQDDVELLKKKRGFNDQTETAIKSVTGEAGSYSQFVINAGKGDSQISELVQSDLSPKLLWILTSQADERNAREKIYNYFRQFDETFQPIDAISWLEQHYPRGLAYIGKKEIDEFYLPTPINPVAAGEESKQNSEQPDEGNFLGITEADIEQELERVFM